MKITNIEIQKKNKNRVNLYIDDKFECGLSLETIMKNHLKVGQELGEKELNFYKNDSEKEVALNKALGYIAKYQKSERELKKYLKDKEFEQDVVEYVAEKLKSYGFVDDKVFATNFVKSKTNNQGKRKIASILKQKGVNETLVDEVLDEFACDSEKIDAVAKKYLKNKPLDIKTKQRAYRYLSSRGYESGDILPCLNRIFKGEEDASWD